MGLKKHDPVHVERKRHGFVPESFVWRGCRYAVRRLEGCWTEVRGIGPHRQERRYFRVRCDRGTFQLYQDTIANTWGVSC